MGLYNYDPIPILDKAHSSLSLSTLLQSSWLEKLCMDKKKTLNLVAVECWAMAGITTSFASKPILSRTTGGTTPFSFSLSSKLFGLRFNDVYLINSSSCSALSSTVSSPITARFGGGGPRRSSNDRRSRQSDVEDDDKALDISTIRWTDFWLMLLYAMYLLQFIKIETWMWLDGLE